MSESSNKKASTASKDVQPPTEQQAAGPGEVCPAPRAVFEEKSVMICYDHHWAISSLQEADPITSMPST
jgi:hypothetical protein